jgi:hypothetical protein
VKKWDKEIEKKQKSFVKKVHPTEGNSTELPKSKTESTYRDRALERRKNEN